MTRQYSKKNCVNTQGDKIYMHSLESETQQLVEDITDMLEAQAELENRPELLEERDIWPELVQKNDKDKYVLFGGLPKTIDKKEIVWKRVSDKEPQINWLYTRNNTLKKECFDMADSYTCVLGYMKEQKIW